MPLAIPQLLKYTFSMGRPARVDYEGALHHVIGRGVNGRPIYHSDGDRRNFLHRVGDILNCSSSQILAWALMPNHFHMLYRTGSVGLTHFMQRLLTGYSISFNNKYDRQGHLFQGRHRAKLVESTAYLYRLVTYIHLNPLRSGVVDRIEELEMYPWSGHRSVMNRNAHAWHDLAGLLGYFGANGDTQLANYRTHMIRACNRGDMETDETGFLIEFPYRDSEDVADDGETDKPPIDELYAITKDTVGKHLDASFDRGHSKGRTPDKLANARAALAFLMVQHGMSSASVSRKLGISRAAVSKALIRGKKIVLGSGFLRRLLPDGKREAVEERPPETS